MFLILDKFHLKRKKRKRESRASNDVLFVF